MTWKVTREGTIEDIAKHNWQVNDANVALVCRSGNQRADASCTGCGAVVYVSEILLAFGPPAGCGGLVAADMADGIHAGLFEAYDGGELDSTSH